MKMCLKLTTDQETVTLVQFMQTTSVCSLSRKTHFYFGNKKLFNKKTFSRKVLKCD